MEQVLEKIKENVAKVMIGKGQVTELLLTGIVAGGHILLEDVPGTGKTVLARALAKSMSLQFGRVQFTPDLLPSDVTGLSFYHQEKGVFEFKEGPVFSNILLADEINRATPRTQSSLLECMAEGQVTVDGKTRVLEAPFFVIATQNPVETLGCFPLPEAQMDRFLMKISMGTLTREEERQMVDRYINAEPLQELGPVCSREEIVKLQKQCREVYVHGDLRNYMVNLIQETRGGADGSAGVSPRGTLALLRASQGYAMVQGRDFVVPEDIKEVAEPVLVHRMLTEDLGEKERTYRIRQLLQQIAVPTENWGAAMILVFALGVWLLLLLWNFYYQKVWDKGLGVQVKFERDYAYAGEETALSLAIENRKRLPIPLLEAAFHVRRELVFQGVDNTKTSDHTYKRDIFSLLGRQRITRRLPLLCSKRGYYEIKDVNFTSYSLFHRRSYLTGRKVQTEFYVYAKRVNVTDLLVSCEKLSGANQCARRLYEDPFAFRGIRDYTTQDPMKTVNWKATAKTGQMMVNTYDSTQMERVMVYLDVADTGILKQEKLLEESISVAATLAQKLMGKGMEVGLVVNCQDEKGELFCLMPEHGRTQLSRIEQLLANLTGKEELVPFGETLLVQPEDVMAIYISKNSRTAAGELAHSAGIWVLPVGAGDQKEEDVADLGPEIHLIRRKVEGA